MRSAVAVATVEPGSGTPARCAARHSKPPGPRGPDRKADKMAMKVWIDQDLCTGDGLCEEISPAVFTLLDDGLAYVKEGDKVERGTMLAEWDPYAIPILTEVDGTVKYGDVVEAVTTGYRRGEAEAAAAGRSITVNAICCAMRTEHRSLTAFGVENKGRSAFRGDSLCVGVQSGQRQPGASRRLAQNPPTRGLRFQWRRSPGRDGPSIIYWLSVPRCLVFRKRPARCCRVRGGLRASPACLFPDAFF